MPGNGTVGASYGDLLLTSLVVLGAVCIAAFVVVRLAGRLLATGRSRGADVLAVVARLPLEPRRSLYVVEVAGKALLVGTSEMGLSLLSELDAGQVRAQAEERPSFGELVRKAWLRRRGIGANGSQDRERARGAVADEEPSAEGSADRLGRHGDGHRRAPETSDAELHVASASRGVGERGESRPSDLDRPGGQGPDRPDVPDGPERRPRAAGSSDGREADERP